MSSYIPEAELCWMPLKQLIETRLFDIIHTEHNNGQHIRLYGAGDYWYGFEESAYLLSRLFETHDITVLKHKDYPFPVVMFNISDDEMQTYGKKHIFRQKAPGYKVLLGMEFSTKQYKK